MVYLYLVELWSRRRCLIIDGLVDGEEFLVFFGCVIDLKGVKGGIVNYSGYVDGFVGSI